MIGLPRRSTLFLYTPPSRPAARQQVQERLSQAHALPNVGSPPIMIQPTAASGRVAMIRLSSSTVSPIDMSVDRKSTRLNSSHSQISYAVFCLKKKQRSDILR